MPASLDSAELLGLLDDPAVAGAWQENGAVAGSREREGWLALEVLIPDSCEGGT
ncbi:MAG: hypothetical protein ACREI9_14660 [Nitrospiraceae bacterium]